MRYSRRNPAGITARGGKFYIDGTSKWFSTLAKAEAFVGNSGARRDARAATTATQHQRAWEVQAAHWRAISAEQQAAKVREEARQAERQAALARHVSPFSIGARVSVDFGEGDVGYGTIVGGPRASMGEIYWDIDPDEDDDEGDGTPHAIDESSMRLLKRGH